MRSRIGLCLAGALFVSCGGSTTPADVAAETAEKLGEVRSGILRLTVTLEGRGSASKGTVGFELDGPFSLPEDGGLPIADIDFVQIAGANRTELGFISTGEKAFVEVDGKVYELPSDQLGDLESAGGSGDRRRGGLGTLDVGDWIVEPELSEGEEVDGAETDRVVGELDVVAALNDIIATARELGAGGFAELEPIEGDDAEQLERAVGESSLELVTGAEDRLLRRLRFEVEFAGEAPEQLQPILSQLAPVVAIFELELREPNEDVEVSEPPGARPLSDLTG